MNYKGFITMRSWPIRDTVLAFAWEDWGKHKPLTITSASGTIRNRAHLEHGTRALSLDQPVRWHYYCVEELLMVLLRDKRFAIIIIIYGLRSIILELLHAGRGFVCVVNLHTKWLQKSYVMWLLKQLQTVLHRVNLKAERLVTSRCLPSVSNCTY